jgi:short-subunit dehydrogenase
VQDQASVPAAARRFCDEGGKVVLFGRTPAKLARVAEDLDPKRCLILTADVSKPEDVARLTSNTVAQE